MQTRAREHRRLPFPIFLFFGWSSFIFCHAHLPLTNLKSEKTTKTKQQQQATTMKFLQFLIPQTPIPTSATEPVPKGSLNAIRTTWTAPSSTVTTVEQASRDIKGAFEAYPQEGQSDIDKGGWEVVDGGSLNDTKFRIELTSGSGFFAKLVNGGEGFKDDVLVEIFVEDPTIIRAEVRSSSRMGKSDMGVNQKRLQFLADQMRSSGWDAPNPEYPK